ncbi:hypothetical protein GE061_009585 [Apolygus lucorum]|uniref:Uncharacterized protein n=1 Tax=Apolygus lucorum TaxID=248454 RepID=A0A6A4KH12_APOLU|nr:hypothetical protein GE061_009585 [Apolygus lucorum]
MCWRPFPGWRTSLIAYFLDRQVSEAFFAQVGKDFEEDDLVNEYDSVEKYRDVWMSACVRKDLITKPIAPPSEVPFSVASGGDKQSFFRLPKLELRQFDIKPKTWISFWACFRKIHERFDLDGEDKFQLLLRMAKEGTPARELLDSFPPSSDNYEKAVTLLKNRFGRDELLVELYVRELLNLVRMQSSGKTSISLSQLFGRLETQLMALESLGVASEKYASMLYPMVESSLPETVLREWERKRVKFDKGLLLEAAERMAELRLFMKAEVESEERLSLARNSFSSSAKSTPSDKQEKGRKPDTTTP